MSTDYFIHKNNKILKNKDTKDFLKLAEEKGYKVRESTHKNGDINNIYITWPGSEYGLELQLGEQEIYGDEEKTESGYWVELGGFDDENIKKVHSILTDFCKSVNFVYNDPQRDRNNLNPDEFLHPSYTKKELEEQKEDWDRFYSPQAEAEWAKIEEDIRRKQYYRIFVKTKNADDIHSTLDEDDLLDSVEKIIKVNDNFFEVKIREEEKNNAEDISFLISTKYPVIMAFKYEFSGYIRYLYKDDIKNEIAYDSKADFVEMDKFKKTDTKLFSTDTDKIKSLVDSKNFNGLDDLINKVLSLSGISV